MSRRKHCAHIVCAENENAPLQQIAEHASTVHNVEVTPEVVEQVKALVRDEAWSIVSQQGHTQTLRKG